MNDPTTIPILQELIDALDRRLPRVDDAGETAIALDAAALRTRALERIAEIEDEPAAGQTVARSLANPAS